MIDTNQEMFIGIEKNCVRPAKWEDVLTYLNNKMIGQKN
jgi:hypothetical protein